jgi:hypothetical protein
MKDGDNGFGRSVHDDGNPLHAFAVISGNEACKGLQLGLADHQ